MRKKKVTLSDIAQKVGISTASVSMILASKSLCRFSDETISAVYEASRELGYENKHIKEDRKLIMIVCPSVINPYFATLLQAMETEAKARGLGTMIYTTYWDAQKERRACELARDPKFGGVIFAMIPQQPELVRLLNESVPVVAVGDRQHDTGFDTVDINNYSAGLLVGKHLLELGHRKIAYLSTSLNSEHSARVRRYEGLKAALKQAGQPTKLLLFTKEFSSQTELETIDVEYHTGYELAIRCIKDNPEVTAMVAVNDMVSYGVIDAVKHSGFSIPEDYSVCGFDNIYPSGFSTVGLTTVEHQIVQGGKSAVKLLCEKMGRRQSESTAITRMEYQSKLVIRNSTGRAPERMV